MAAATNHSSLPPLRLIAVGCGRVFRRYHLPAILATPQVRLVGACETHPDRLAWAREALVDVRCAASLDELLRSVEADAALIATPPRTHGPLAGSALRAGLSVLVEKPMAITLEEARSICDLGRGTGRVLRVGFNRRYRGEYLRLRRRAENRVDRVAFTFIAERGRWNPEEAVTAPFVLYDAGSHAMDLVAYVAGRRIERVRARVEEGPDFCVVHLDADFGAGTSATCTVGHGSAYREHLAVTSRGRELRAVASPNWAGRARLAFCKVTGRPTPTDRSFRAQLAGFAAACRSHGDPIGAGAADGFASVAALEAALRSIDCGGEWRDVPDFLATTGLEHER